MKSLVFTASSTSLASCARDGARLWPLVPGGGRQRLIALGEDYFCYGIAADPRTEELLVTAAALGAFLVSADRASLKRIEGIPPTVLWGGALDTRAGLAAVGVNYAEDRKDMVIHVANLASGVTRTIATRDATDKAPFAGGVGSLDFMDVKSLISGGGGGVFRWNIETGARATLAGGPGLWGTAALGRQGSRVVAATWRLGAAESSELFVIDLKTDVRRRISTHGHTLSAVAIDTTGERIATGDAAGVVRVGRASEDEPYLLLGHRDPVAAVAFSPDGKWVASAAGTEIPPVANTGSLEASAAHAAARPVAREAALAHQSPCGS